MTTREDFLSVALAERGPCRHADGSTKYGDWFAGEVGDPAYRDGDFCAMGLLWCGNQVSRLDLLGGAHREWAWVPSWWQHWQSIGRTASTPGRGRISFYDFNQNGTPEHVGATLVDHHDGSFDAIEFNTLNGQCAIRTRTLSEVLGFGDPAWGATPAPAAAVGNAWFLGA